ncbi:S8 family serine peptidase [Neobacillus bataviensis]|uniref:S8 family serine peptidase n=1 Tax=Neobacillus bataviensis TaxID=220685 RepID=UPI001CBB052F|nr:S8 family serine peptidase [Neobacillus bataviensis]
MKKATKNKVLKVLSAGVLTTSLVATCLIPGQTSYAAGDTGAGIKDIDSYLKNISSADRNKIGGIEEIGAKGLQFSSDVNLNEDTPLTVIVQFKQDPAVVDFKKNEANGLKANLDDSNQLVEQSHISFKNQLKGNGKLKDSAEIKREYKHAFNGAAVTLPANQVKELMTLDTVKAVYENKTVTAEPSVEQYGEMTSTTTDTDHVKLTDMEQIGAEKLHEEGVTGKGIKVGVIDTGIDYTHPDLKDVYKGGYDFVNNDNDPMETTYDDWKNSGKPEFNPTSGEPYYTAHGTHVSGTIAGTGKNHSSLSVTGVAPEVELHGYKVLGPYGTGNDEAILAGIDKALEDGMNVINLSLGAPIANPLDPLAVAINNATLAGTVCVLAAGNAGSNHWTIGSPASSALGITVGASTSPLGIETSNGVASAAGQSANLENMRMLALDYNPLNALTGTSYQVLYVGKGAVSSYSGRNVKDKIVLIERGDYSLHDKIVNAKNAGAKAAIIFNNIPGEDYIPYYLGMSFEYLPTFNVTSEQGNAILNLVRAGAGTANLTLNSFGSISMGGDKLADFSSRGPARRYYDIKPEITAPGVAVLSSVPAYDNGAAHKDDYEHAYARFDGTSMAAPHVAGAAALLLQTHPDYTPEQVKLALMNTADRLNGSYSVFEQGAGRLDIYEAVHSTTSISVKDEVPSLDEMGDTITIKEHSGDMSFGPIVTTDKDVMKKKSITLENHSDVSKSFEVKVNFQQIAGYSNDAAKNGVTLSVPSEVIVETNDKANIKATLNVPTTAELGLYEGYITITNKSDANETYQIPFGLNKLVEGIHEVLLSTKAFNTRRDLPFAISGSTQIGFSLDSRMQTVDILLKNADTGEELGMLGTATGGFNEGMTFGLDGGFNGLYNAFTGNPDQPVHFTKSLAAPGRYEIEIVGTNEEGKVFKKSKPIVIENTLPTLKMNTPGGVYEVDDTGLKISGNITDGTVDLLNQYGDKVDQSANTVKVTGAVNPFGNVPLVVDSKGNFEYTRTIQAGKEFSSFTLVAQDIATNGVQGQPDSTFTLVKKGVPYAKLTSNLTNAKYGDTVKITLSAHNLKNFMGGDFTLTYPKQLMDYVGAELTTEFTNAATEKGLTATITTQNIPSDTSNNWIRVLPALTGNNPTAGINESIPVATLTFKVKEQQPVYTKWVQTLNIQTAKANLLGLPQMTLNNKFGQNINILPTYSVLEGGFLPDGFIPSNQIWLDPKRDYSKIGAEVYLVGAKDGKRYDATVNSAARFIVSNLPLLDQSYDIVIKIPGHFERHMKAEEMVDSFDGVPVGKDKYFYYSMLRAGDVNHDNIIDIMDAVYINSKLGTNDRDTDINYDGVVDEKDLFFVEMNYMMVNPDIPTKNKPVSQYKGKTLDDYIQS